MSRKLIIPLLSLSFLLGACVGNGDNNNTDSTNTQHQENNNNALSEAKAIVRETDADKKLESSSHTYHKASASGNLYITKKGSEIVKLENEETDNGLQRNDDYYFNTNGQLVYSYHFLYYPQGLSNNSPSAREMKNYYDNGQLIKSLERHKMLAKGEEPDLSNINYAASSAAKDSVTDADQQEVSRLKSL